MAEPPVPLALWRAAPSQELLWAHWGGDFVLFHRASGLTHLVNHATAKLLRGVLTVPRSVDEAAACLAKAEGAEAGPQFAAEVLQLVQRLEALGLVERVTS